MNTIKIFGMYLFDFKKEYDSIHTDNLYNIMNDFGFPEKLINLTRMYIEKTKCMEKMDNDLSSLFPVDTGLKQGDSLAPVLFNQHLEKVVREFQVTEDVI